MIYFTFFVLAIMQALIMRTLPKMWRVPWNKQKSYDPGPFYAAWGIFWLNTILLWLGIIPLTAYLIMAGCFAAAFIPIFWGFQHPTQKGWDVYRGLVEQLDAITDELSYLQKRYGIRFLLR